MFFFKILQKTLKFFACGGQAPFFRLRWASTLCESPGSKRAITLPYYKNNAINNVVECPVCPSDSGGTAVWLLNFEEHLRTYHPKWKEESSQKQASTQVLLKDAQSLRSNAKKELAKDQKRKARARTKSGGKDKGKKRRKINPDGDWIP